MDVRAMRTPQRRMCATLMRVCCVFPECRAHSGVWGFVTALSAATAPNVASHADLPPGMSRLGLYKRINYYYY